MLLVEAFVIHDSQKNQAADNPTGRLEKSIPHESLRAKTPGRQREQGADAVLNRRL